MVARAVFTTKTDVLPWPSLKRCERTFHHRLFWKRFIKVKKEKNSALQRSKKQIFNLQRLPLGSLTLHASVLQHYGCKWSVFPLHFTLQWRMSKAQMWEYITSRRLSGEMLLTGHRLPAGSWAAGLWTAPRWSGGWWACACSAGRKWWTVPFRDGPPRGQRWGPWCWCHSLGKPRWHSKCLPGALGGKQEGQNGKGRKCQRQGQQVQANPWLHGTHCYISSAQISVCRRFCTSITEWSPNLEPLRNNHGLIMVRCQTYFRSFFLSFKIQMAEHK